MTTEKKSNAADHLEPWRQLEGKVVFVTGASAGLGREYCLDLARAGCKVVAAARRADRLKSLCDEINANVQIVRAVAVELNVTADGPSIEASVQKAWDAFGHIDVLINNAGVRGGLKSAVDISEEEWHNTLRTNLTGSWIVSKYVGKHMQAAKRGGSIINISSIGGLNRISMRGGIAYSSSKAAVDTMTKVMAYELGEHNIRVNAIAPGIFKSEITEKLLQKDWVKNVATRSVPLKTFGTTNPGLTTLVRYLIHDSSNYVSGNIFIVDSGSWLVSKYVGKHMQAAKRGGSIINISSIGGLNRISLRGGIAYSSSKAAMDTMTKIMALELGEHNIRVNTIAPGLFKSEITDKLLQKDWLKNVATRAVPLKTFGTSNPALTSLVRYLVHGSSNYISGNIFIVDAGYSLPGVPIFSSL